MTTEEFRTYFEGVTLPDELRLDRACRQMNVPDRVKRLLENMAREPENWRHEHQLMRIKTALETPYNGPDIPRF